MNTFNKKSLYAAIAGVSALGMAGTADAVHVNPDGLGQVLIYPYYTHSTRGVAQYVREPPVQLAAVGRELDCLGEGRQGPLPGRQGLAAKCLTSTCTCRHNDVWTAGVNPDGRRRRHRHVRQVLHDADRLERRCEPDAVRQLHVRVD